MNGTILDVLRDRAARTPDRVVFRFDEDDRVQSVTFADLARAARSMAAALNREIAPGQRVLLVYPAGVPFIEALFGCLMAGIIAAPIYPGSVTDRSSSFEAIVENAAPAAVLTTGATLARLRKRGAAQGNLRWLPTDAIDVTDGDARASRPEPQDIALLQYTSSTTGKAKGVMVTHANILHNTRAIRETYSLTDGSRGVCWLPPYHDMGLIGGVLQTVSTGMETLLFSALSFAQHPLRWLAAISSHRAELTAAPDFAYELAAAKLETLDGPLDLDLRTWRVAISGAEPVRASTMRRFAAATELYGFRAEAFFPSYGLAESTLIATGRRNATQVSIRTIDRHAAGERVVREPRNPLAAQEIVGCGRPVGGMRVLTVDPERRLPCPDESIGEVWMAGDSVTAGYWNLPEETASTFCAFLANSDGPFLRTGDLAFRVGGELFVTGRIKDLIIVRGRNHDPAGIERSVEQCSPRFASHGAAAFTVAAQSGEMLVVMQETTNAVSKDERADLLARARAAVANEHQLSLHDLVLVRRGSLPRTTSGKIQRFRCRLRYVAGEVEGIAVS